jgi:hypothetical protein
LPETVPPYIQAFSSWGTLIIMMKLHSHNIWLHFLLLVQWVPVAYPCSLDYKQKYLTSSKLRILVMCNKFF